MPSNAAVNDASASDGRLYRRLLRLARPYHKLLGVLLLLELVDSLWALLTPLPLKIAIDHVLGQRPLPEAINNLLPSGASSATLLGAAVGLLIVVALLAGLQSLVSTVLRGYVGERLVLDFRSQLF